ncbi:MAG: chemotaxis protein CheD [Spirochaetales bacterium]|nr:chemotaxis protein CheD [Spirochaetales bacterium]
MKKVYVGIGEYAVAHGQSVLQTILGSCVGVVIFDKFHRIGGLAHIYLPHSSVEKQTRINSNSSMLASVPKYADLLIPMMINSLVRQGADKQYFTAYLVGGASIFSFHKNPSLNVGKKNLDQARLLLKQEMIRTVEVKVGGTTGRKVTFDCYTGDLEVMEFSENIN